MMEFSLTGVLRDWLWELAHAFAILAIAGLLGGLVGLERQVHGHWAGFRTHMAVSVGAAMFLVAGKGFGLESEESASRIVQGIATGIGFLGAGTILKLVDRLEVKGLTTASSIWMAAAVGTACGLRRFGVAVAGVALALIVLAVLRPAEKWLNRKHPRV
jgi:putative Mg2+ transporter-C (MgtC) family protein